jgi:hypothetical protein
MRAIAGGAEIVAHGGDHVRIEPVHPRVPGSLADSIRLRHAVQRRVLPGEDRGPARRAGGRLHVVPPEVDAVFAKNLLCVKVLVHPQAQLGAVVDRRIPQLVNEKEKDIGMFFCHRKEE